MIDRRLFVSALSETEVRSLIPGTYSKLLLKYKLLKYNKLVHTIKESCASMNTDEAFMYTYNFVILLHSYNEQVLSCCCIDKIAKLYFAAI